MSPRSPLHFYFNNRLIVQCMKCQKIVKNAGNYSFKPKLILLVLSDSQKPKDVAITIMENYQIFTFEKLVPVNFGDFCLKNDKSLINYKIIRYIKIIAN